nr:glycosyltransferase family 2 protein [Escherichia coli]
MNICIATMMKNEADALIEWVCYHLAIGIDSFIVANNESTDSTEEILKLLSEFCDLKYFNFETPKNTRP